MSARRGLPGFFGTTFWAKSECPRWRGVFVPEPVEQKQAGKRIGQYATVTNGQATRLETWVMI